MCGWVLNHMVPQGWLLGSPGTLLITLQIVPSIWENIAISLHHFVLVHKYILFARQTIPWSTLQTAIARHHSFTSSQSEIKSTTTLLGHHPPPPSSSQPPHPRRPPPAVRVGCSEARASKQGGSSAAGVWASTVAQRAAALDSLWQLRRAAAVYNSCGNCRRDNRFPNSDARCALVPADTVLPEKAFVQCFARITRAFNSYSQITF